MKNHIKYECCSQQFWHLMHALINDGSGKMVEILTISGINFAIIMSAALLPIGNFVENSVDFVGILNQIGLFNQEAKHPKL